MPELEVKSSRRKREAPNLNENENDEEIQNLQTFKCSEQSFNQTLDTNLDLDHELQQVRSLGLQEDEKKQYFVRYSLELLAKDFEELREINLCHHRSCDKRKRDLDNRRRDLYKNFAVLGTTIDGATIHKQALEGVRLFYNPSLKPNVKSSTAFYTA